MASVILEGISHCYEVNAFELNIDSLCLEDGRITALVGESGCGKTTLLRSIAGLEIPGEGSINIGGRVVNDRHLFVPPEKRNVGMVFQDYALFPHLTVRQNLEFGLSRLSLPERERRIKEYTTMSGLEAFLNRYPHELSGGQQQRVALARALVCMPNVLLLDEPFSNMDEPLKVKLRSEIKALLIRTRITTLLVSHDIRDAFAIADNIVILRHGKVVQTGSAEEIISNPNNEYVKSLVNIKNAPA